MKTSILSTLILLVGAISPQAQITLEGLNFKLDLKRDGSRETIFVNTKGEEIVPLTTSSSLDFQDYFIDKMLLCILYRSLNPFSAGLYNYSLRFYTYSERTNVWESTYAWDSDENFTECTAGFAAKYAMEIACGDKKIPVSYSINEDLSKVTNLRNGSSSNIDKRDATIRIKDGRVILD